MDRQRKTQAMTGRVTVLVLLGAILWGCAGIRINRSLQENPSDWKTFGGAPSRANQSGTVIVPPLREVWEYNALAGIRGTPLVQDSVVLVVTLSGEIQAVHLTTGDRIGYLVLESAIAGTPAWNGSFVYVPIASGEETLVCIGLRNAERPWSAMIGPIESSPLLHGELLYVTTLDGILYCLNKADGSELWKFETAEEDSRKPIRSSPASDGATIVFGSDDGYVYAVDRTNGQLRWKFQTGASVFATPVVTRNVCVIGSQNGTVFSLEMRSGKLIWKFDTGSMIYASAAATDTMVYIGSADGRLHALRVDSGERLWTFSARSIINSAPLIAGDILYLGSMDRTLYALSSKNGQELWRYDATGRVRVSPVIWGDVLLLTSEDKFVTALKPVEQ